MHDYRDSCSQNSSHYEFFLFFYKKLPIETSSRNCNPSVWNDLVLCLLWLTACKGKLLVWCLDNFGGVRIMRTTTILFILALIIGAPGALAQDKQPFDILAQVVDKIIERENQEIQTVRKYSPLVETYVQRVSNKTAKEASWEPDGDR
jgi:hypothetical protein